MAADSDSWVGLAAVTPGVPVCSPRGRVESSQRLNLCLGSKGVSTCLSDRVALMPETAEGKPLGMQLLGS